MSLVPASHDASPPPHVPEEHWWWWILLISILALLLAVVFIGGYLYHGCKQAERSGGDTHVVSQKI
jgi:hypothetical protein